MAYVTMATITTGTLVTASDWNQVGDNFDFLAAFGVAGTAFSGLSSSTDMAKISIGTYTGNGGTTQAITGVGFQPRFVMIWRQTDAAADSLSGKTSSDGSTNSMVEGGIYKNDHIRALDSNGFTVGDGTGDANRLNVNTAVYTYIAYR